MTEEDQKLNLQIQERVNIIITKTLFLVLNIYGNEIRYPYICKVFCSQFTKQFGLIIFSFEISIKMKLYYCLRQFFVCTPNKTVQHIVIKCFPSIIPHL